jgi:hypothetical protein
VHVGLSACTQGTHPYVQVDLQTILAEEKGRAVIPAEQLRRATRGTSQAAVCPAAWRLLLQLPPNAWGMTAILQLAASISQCEEEDARKEVVLGFHPSNYGTFSAMWPSKLTPVRRVQQPPAVSHEHASEGLQSLLFDLQPLQLLEALSALLCEALEQLKHSSSALLQLLLSPQQTGPLNDDAITCLTTLLVSPRLQFNTMAEAVVGRLSPTSDFEEAPAEALQAGLSALVRGSCSHVMLEALLQLLQDAGELVKRSAGIGTWQQLAMHQNGSLEALLVFQAKLLSCLTIQPGPDQTAEPADKILSPLADQTWSLSSDILSAATSQNGCDPVHQLHGPAEALLIAAIRAMAVTWVTHQSSVLELPSAELAKKLDFLGPLLSVPGALAHMTHMHSSLMEVWCSAVMAVTDALPSPVPWTESVQEQAVALLSQNSVPGFVKNHISRLLGPAAPGNLFRLQPGRALSELPRRAQRIIDLTTPEPARSPVKPQDSGVLPGVVTPPSKRPKPLSLPESPLLQAWERATSQSPATKAQSTEHHTEARSARGISISSSAPMPKHSSAASSALVPRLTSKPAICPSTMANLEAALIRKAGPKRMSKPSSAPPKKKRLRDIVDGNGQSSDDEKALDDDEFFMPLRRSKPPYRPFKAGATHITIARHSTLPQASAHAGVMSTYHLGPIDSRQACITILECSCCCTSVFDKWLSSSLDRELDAGREKPGTCERPAPTKAPRPRLRQRVSPAEASEAEPFASSRPVPPIPPVSRPSTHVATSAAPSALAKSAAVTTDMTRHIAIPRTDEEIARMAKKLKEANANASSVKLLPMPSQRSAAFRKPERSAASARIPDLHPASTERLFVRGLLACSVDALKR